MAPTALYNCDSKFILFSIIGFMITNLIMIYSLYSDANITQLSMTALMLHYFLFEYGWYYTRTRQTFIHAEMMSQFDDMKFAPNMEILYVRPQSVDSSSNDDLELDFDSLPIEKPEPEPEPEIVKQQNECEVCSKLAEKLQ